jgi:integrase
MWQRKRDGVWMTTIHGVQHKLHKDKTEARKALNRLLGSDQPPPARRSGMTTRKLCDDFLVRTAGGKDAATHEVQVMHLNAFCEALGHRDPATLKVHEVEKWLSERPGWADSTKALCVTIVKAAFNWGAEQGHLSVNPIKKLKRRDTGRRERLLTPEERERIKAAVSWRMRDFLEVLEQTGCRPFSEAAKLEAKDVDFEKGRSVRRKHKNEKKGKTRTIYFPPKALERLKELAEKYPTGPLLRNRRGNAWTRISASHYLTRVCKKLKMPQVTAYAFRHTYITEALVRGVPVDVLAELVGNSPAVLRKNYSHIAQMDDALAAAALKAVGG